MIAMAMQAAIAKPARKISAAWRSRRESGDRFCSSMTAALREKKRLVNPPAGQRFQRGF
jgi:hypothetical protein